MLINQHKFYSVERFNPGQAATPLAVLSVAAVSADTSNTDFACVVTIIHPARHRTQKPAIVYTCDDSGDGYLKITVPDGLAYAIAQFIGPELSPDDCETIEQFCGSLVISEHDPDQHAPPNRLLLGSPYPYRP